MLQFKDKYTIDEVLKIFELSHNDVPNLRRPFQSMSEAQRSIARFRLKIRKQYRLIAKKYHPDHGTDADREQREHDFKVLQKVYEIVMKKIMVIPIQPRPTVVRFYYSSNSSFYGETSSTTTNGYW